MADRSKRHSHDFLHIPIFESIRRTCKSFLRNCCTVKNTSFSKKNENNTKHRTIQEDFKKSPKNRNQNPNDRFSEDKPQFEVQEIQDSELENLHEMHASRLKKQFSIRSSFKHRGSDQSGPRSPQTSPPASRSASPSPLVRNTSSNHSPLSRSTSPSPLVRNTSSNHSPLSRSTSLRSQMLRTMSRTKSMSAKSGPLPHSFSRSTSRRSSTVIMYSNSNGFVKPPPMEEQLDCTLEELCFGCIKKVKIKKDTVTEDGQILEKDEVLTIKVNPGWGKGTKITFEGMGNETPGTDPADVIFTVAEKPHLIFRKEGDDLELEVEIQLVEALTGCSISVPTLGGQAMCLTVDDVIYPGYEKIIEGQGMPKHNEPETRGNLRVTFLVEFPEELTVEQRSDVVNILQQTHY